MFLDLDIVALLLGLASLPFLVFLLRRETVPKTRPLYAGFCAIIAAQVLSLAGAALPNTVFPALEHASLALGGLLFAVGFRNLGRERTRWASSPFPRRSQRCRS